MSSFLILNSHVKVKRLIICDNIGYNPDNKFKQFITVNCAKCVINLKPHLLFLVAILLRGHYVHWYILVAGVLVLAVRLAQRWHIDAATSRGW